MRESRPYGSVRGALRDERPYRVGALEVIKNIAIDAQRDLFFGA
jgi:hypothetical protein